MSANSSIEWTDRTWNPVRGCSVISPGCVNCYAMKQAHRFSGARIDKATSSAHKHGNDRAPKTKAAPYAGLTKQTSAGPQWTGKIKTVESALLAPLSWRKPARVFVNSMSDLFHEDVSSDFIDQVFAAMAMAPQHTFQILTKRADRMRAYINGDGLVDGINGRSWRIREAGHAFGRKIEENVNFALELPNVWLGVSVENQKYADERIPLLLQTPAAVRFISAEPLLGPINLGAHIPAAFRRRATLDWVIVGGESGPRARPFEVGWAWSIVKQCNEAGVACFVKQLGSVPIVPAGRQQHWDWQTIDRPEDNRFREHGADGAFWRLNLKDKKGGNSAEWMKGLRVREFPNQRAFDTAITNALLHVASSAPQVDAQEKK